MRLKKCRKFEENPPKLTQNKLHVVIQLGMLRGNKGKSLYQSDSGLHHTISMNYIFVLMFFRPSAKIKTGNLEKKISTFGKNTVAGLVNQKIKNKWPNWQNNMKSLFADFLQNVMPPGAFKWGYTVYMTALWLRVLIDNLYRKDLGIIQYHTKKPDLCWITVMTLYWEYWLISSTKMTL